MSCKWYQLPNWNMNQKISSEEIIKETMQIWNKGIINTQRNLPETK